MKTMGRTGIEPCLVKRIMGHVSQGLIVRLYTIVLHRLHQTGMAFAMHLPRYQPIIMDLVLIGGKF